MYTRIDAFIKVVEAKRLDQPTVWYSLYTELREAYALFDPEAVKYLDARWSKVRGEQELSVWDEKFTEATIDTEAYATKMLNTIKNSTIKNAAGRDHFADAQRYDYEKYLQLEEKARIAAMQANHGYQQIAAQNALGQVAGGLFGKAYLK